MLGAGVVGAVGKEGGVGIWVLRLPGGGKGLGVAVVV